MKGINFSAPDIGYLREKEILEVWDWIAALDAFHYCDPEPLSEMLAGGEPIPEFMRLPLSEIVAGTRKPNKKAAAKLKIPARERMKVGAMISGILGLADCLAGEISDGHGGLQRGCEIAADRKGIELIDAVRHHESMRKKAIEIAMDEFGVSEETVENLLRDVREKIRNFPEM